MSEYDSLQRFLFEDLGIRGELVRLDASWRSVQERHPYPPKVAEQLGQALAATLLLSATIKFQGSLILQAQSGGPIQTLVAQATHHRGLRGLARWQGEVAGRSLAELFGEGRLVLTIQNEGNEPYQGIVPLEGANLAAALQSYFALSEQLPTRLWLAADGQRATGLFIQELPAQRRSQEDWDRITYLADTVTEAELLKLPRQELLYRLFNEERVRVFESEPVAFRCGCSRERIEGLLAHLAQDAIESIAQERGMIEVDCEFCNRHYSFDPIDVRLMYSGQPKPPSSTTRQ
ncbi:Hsp33 family molecular chaperone HslO [Methylomagnum ishizawai]|uniref:Hsp33 family molecular chaperone HslO n=1 Tax=Methylomagnum ishizawai TaxID=1760988 RepID=UPI001C336922|nr:Hsp33 family molecular chaperone HslO [Methylomagnum ishizawai]BBL73381.1 33 kDa chaperonin [Methylomagnum ishizawai]